MVIVTHIYFLKNKKKQNGIFIKIRFAYGHAGSKIKKNARRYRYAYRINKKKTQHIYVRPTA